MFLATSAVRIGIESGHPGAEGLKTMAALMYFGVGMGRRVMFLHERMRRPLLVGTRLAPPTSLSHMPSIRSESPLNAYPAITYRRHPPNMLASLTPLNRAQLRPLNATVSACSPCASTASALAAAGHPPFAPRPTPARGPTAPPPTTTIAYYQTPPASTRTRPWPRNVSGRERYRE
ncbi:hypothetical protein K432DRAFT_34178 [Lepidopterella palustris CBS 459.81]|uniref:Uncharacterized protein n=1 Tax=Lepidopterella palustris CBS 459.81 TaxID=1314670 RepID=A0A8E2JKL8_9PEZI|nr:hypothetical protein K432DRAFT_34178 [Lepidopterella palustris CBS 459.81]